MSKAVQLSEARRVVRFLNADFPGVDVVLADENGEVPSETPDSVSLLVGETEIVGTATPGIDGGWSFPIGTLTAEVAVLRSVVGVVYGVDTITLVGPTLFVLDSLSMWADPLEIAEGLPDVPVEDILIAIQMSEVAVRAWVVTPVTSPVSDRVTRAVTLLTTRALTSPSGAGGPALLSETMGDYTARFASPLKGGFVIDSDVAELLAPWGRPKVSSAYIGPKEETQLI